MICQHRQLYVTLLAYQSNEGNEDVSRQHDIMSARLENAQET